MKWEILDGQVEILFENRIRNEEIRLKIGVAPIDEKMREGHYALFVSTMMFSRKWVIFQEAFFIKLSHFPMFGGNFKWVKKQPPNFLYLAYCEIELFSKKI